MADLMTFPETLDSFLDQYKFIDKEQIYTNGAELIPVFRVKQWAEHIGDVKPVVHGKWVELYNYYYDNAYGCSVCGAQFIMIECTPQDNLWKFCPNCGSDMRQ